MPYEEEEEDLQWGEPNPVADALAKAVIGAASEVHRELGAGLDEILYEIAMAKELQARGIPFERQVCIQVAYKGEVIGEKRIDFIIDRLLILELKAVSELSPLHKAQLKTYLKITKLEPGLLINFNVPLLKNGIKRVVYHS